MSRSVRRVVKLGGSLLDWSGVWNVVRGWINAQGPSATILVVGGGELVESLRTLDRLHGLDPARAHDWCIRAMALQAEMTRDWLPEAAWLDDLDRWLVQTQDPGLWVLEPWHFIDRIDRLRSTTPLPASWDVTSDSIAARLAEWIGADELVLLKSAPAPSTSHEACAAAGYVDAYFPEAARHVAHVRLVDLRHEIAAAQQC